MEPATKMKGTDEASVVKKLTLLSVIGNAVLTAIKMAAGILGHSGAMVSDAVHSLSDVLTTVIAAIGVRMAGKSADREHPYGHERIESVASLFLALMLGVTGLALGWAGIRNVFDGSYRNMAVPTPIALLAAIISIATKEAMFRYTIINAKKIKSDAFIADAWHHRSDALSSIGSLIGIGAAMLGAPVMDSVASVVICVFILHTAYEILKDSIDKMLDTSCSEKTEKEISAFIARQEGVLSVDSLHTRQFGNRIYVDAEIAVDGKKTLEEAHRIAEDVHRAVEKEYADVKHIMIHENPAK